MVVFTQFASIVVTPYASPSVVAWYVRYGKEKYLAAASSSVVKKTMEFLPAEIHLSIIEMLGQYRIIKGKKTFNPVLLINKHFYTLKKTPCKFCFSGTYKPHGKRWHTITCDTLGH